jgi:hypothetical protein
METAAEAVGIIGTGRLDLPKQEGRNRPLPERVN